jgi:hypothetical protein
LYVTQRSMCSIWTTRPWFQVNMESRGKCLHNFEEAELIFSLFFFFLNFFNIAPLTCAFELSSGNSHFNSYCRHLSLRSILSKYLENLDYLLCAHKSTFIDLHQFSREKWISLFEVRSKPSNKNSVLYSV